MSLRDIQAKSGMVGNYDNDYKYEVSIGLLLRQSRIFRVCRVLLVRIFYRVN